ncbi:MAG: SpoIIE family protein phosphatase [Candidatus Omnitrophica bacterium]|nr:SpoIIE family protein phosphatase [Candidatus Omnitrophota bacterium]
MKNKHNLSPTFIDASSLLVSTLDAKEILPRAMEIIKDLLGCETASIMLVNQREKKLTFEVALGEKGEAIKQISLPLGKGIAGKVALSQKPKLVKNVEKCAEFDKSFDEKSGFQTKSILCVPIIFKGITIGVAQAINPCKKNTFDENDLYLLSLFCNQVALAIESARLHERILTQRHLEDELNFARTIQQSFLPQDFPETKQFAFYGMNAPARKVGGDFYDFFVLDEDRIGFTIGDVSGKGIPAALFMAKILSQIKIISQKKNNLLNPAMVLEELNSSLLERHSDNMFVTLIYGIFSPKKKTITLASAAHPYPFLYSNKQSKWENLHINNGLPLGVVNDTRYTSQEIKLADEDILVFFTDGILEADNAQGNPFIPYIFSQISAQGCIRTLAKTILTELKDFVTSSHSFDDVTLLIIKCKGQSS